jgi:hypothetical protein
MTRLLLKTYQNLNLGQLIVLEMFLEFMKETSKSWGRGANILSGKAALTEWQFKRTLHTTISSQTNSGIILTRKKL